MIVILDWDGTLVDSAGQIVATMQAAARTCNLPAPSEDQIRHIIGLGLPEAIRSLFPRLDAAQVDALREAYAVCYRAAAMAPAPFFPGVTGTLRALLENGIELAIATGKSRRGLDRELRVRQLEGLFLATRCADESASKPDPLMLHQILQQVGKTPDQAVMVGDTVFDMDMARRANMKRIAVTYGAHPQSALADSAPNLLVDDFSTILDWIVKPCSDSTRELCK
jgi:phosphoglycolate phosphatase